MSFLKKIFPFLFKSEGETAKPATTAAKEATPKKPSVAKGGNGSTTPSKSSEESENVGPMSSPIVAYGIIARNRNARGLRKGSRVYVRSILEDGDRLRVRGTAPNGSKVTLTVPRRTLADFESEGVPEHVAKHYDAHSMFKEEHEAKMKAEALGKH
jgi:hypothetical protein